MRKKSDVEKLNRMNFRACLEALARPGNQQFLEPVFQSSLLAMASVLLYSEVSFSYCGDLDFSIIKALCGASETSPDMADYIFADEPDPKLLASAKPGTADSPESNATLVIGCPPFAIAQTNVRLTGPGINEAVEIVLPVSLEFIALLQEKNELFPMGIDLFLVGSDNLMIGLPRTTRIEVSQ